MPLLFEGGIVGLLTFLILDMPFTLGLSMVFLLGAVSPAVLVPSLMKL